MSPFAVRPAEARDAEGMARIAAANRSSPQWTAAQFGEMLQPRDAAGTLCRAALVAECAGELAGFAVASAVCAVFPAEAELESLAVDPALQGLGIGRSLLKATLQWAAARGAETLQLEVRASNTRALRIYSEAGFHPTGRRPGYYTQPNEDAVVMERTLDHAVDGGPERSLA